MKYQTSLGFMNKVHSRNAIALTPLLIHEVSGAGTS